MLRGSASGPDRSRSTKPAEKITVTGVQPVRVLNLDSLVVVLDGPDRFHPEHLHVNVGVFLECSLAFHQKLCVYKWEAYNHPVIVKTETTKNKK